MTGPRLFGVLVALMPEVMRSVGQHASAIGPEETGRALFDAARVSLPPGRFGVIAETLEVLARHVRAEGIRREGQQGGK